jgi:hypothetical protein
VSTRRSAKDFMVGGRFCGIHPQLLDTARNQIGNKTFVPCEKFTKSRRIRVAIWCSPKVGNRMIERPHGLHESRHLIIKGGRFTGPMSMEWQLLLGYWTGLGLVTYIFASGTVSISACCSG